MTGDVQSLPAPGRVKGDRHPSCALQANQSRNLTRNQISPMLSRLFKWETYVQAISFLDIFLTILVHFFPFFSLEMSIDTHINACLNTDAYL